MKHAFSSPVRLGLKAAGMVIASSAALAQPAHASGVGAGTLIQNTASATYTSGPGTSSVTSNTVTVRVDELLNVAVAGLTTNAVATGAANVVLEYSVTNGGNGPEAFKLTANPSVAGNNFNVTVQSVVVDSNGNGVYDAGVDQVVAAGGVTPILAADASIKVFVVVSLPGGATDAQTSQVRLTADANTGTGAPGTVFAGQGDGGGDAVVGATTASANALDSLVASLASVSLVKSATVLDPFGGSQPVPGAVITYTLVATVAGSGSVGSLHITDLIPTGTTYQAGTLRLEAAALTDAVDADAGAASATGIDVNAGTVNAGTTKTVKFSVKIN